MSESGTVAAARDAPLFAWLGPLAGFAEMGTAGYPRAVRRRLTIVNVMAFLIAIFSAVYACVFAYYDAKTFMPLIVINVLLVAVALLVPLAHRINDIAGALVIAVAEYSALFFFVAALGHNSGIQINYIIAAAVAFAIYGLSHFRIVVAVIAAGLLLHLAAWYLFPPERALIAADPALLANLYVSSAVTTFCIIALIVGYAFTVADRARAEADALLANILPEAIAERLKERPGETVADSIAEASVLFSDLVDRLARRRDWRRCHRGEDQDHRRRLYGGGRRQHAASRPSAAARAHGAQVARSRRAAFRHPRRRSQDQGGHRRWASDGRRDRRRQVLLRRLGRDGESGLAAGVARASRRDSGLRRGEGSAWRQFRVRATRGDRGEGRWTAGDLAIEGGARRPRLARGSRLCMTGTWRAITLTIFPEMFPGPLGLSLAGKALSEGRWALSTIDIRDFATDKHRSVDDTPAGGGAGMVMRADIAAAAIDAARASMPADTPTIYLSPRGRQLTQARVRELARGPGVILLCGRFEGVDQRVFDARNVEEVSIGDFVLSGGELAAQVLIDACVRLLPGVAGNEISLAEESFASGLLEYPHYTRPRDWEGRAIPDVLLSGDHEKIAKWRREQAEKITKERRPDLWKGLRRD